MAIDVKTYGIDVHPQYQAGFAFETADNDYQWAFVKASQGASYVPPGLDAFYGRARRSKMRAGLYHFLEAGASGKAQAAHFLKQVEKLGGPRRMLLAVDFEHYAGGDPSNKQLDEFIAEVKRRTDDHPIWLYTAKSFWEGGDASGPFKQYGADVLWAAHYADMARHDKPKIYFKSLDGWGWDTVGGKVADAHQFTSAGLVAGQYIDVNASTISPERLARLAGEGEKNRPPPVTTGKPATGSGTGGTGPGKARAKLDERAPWQKGDCIPPNFHPKPVQPGGYVAQHPTRFFWREDVLGMVRKIYRRWPDDTFVNTYVGHPPGWEQYERVSLDVWGPRGRGYKLDPEIGDDIWRFLFNYEPKPDWQWGIYKGRMWSQGAGWEASPWGPPDSDPGHWKHIHISYEI